MREFARAFYLSKEWRTVRDFVFYELDLGLCRRCGEPGAIVHHIEEITPKNINDPEITLNPDNLENVCRSCHAAIHNKNPSTGDGLMFNEYGDLVEIEVVLMPFLIPTPR